MPSRNQKQIRSATKKKLQKDVLSRKAMGTEVIRYISERKLSQVAAAKQVGDHATQISRLSTGNFNEFSQNRLAKFLTKLGYGVELRLIRPGPRSKKTGWSRVTVVE